MAANSSHCTLTLHKIDKDSPVCVQRFIMFRSARSSLHAVTYSMTSRTVLHQKYCITHVRQSVPRGPSRVSVSNDATVCYTSGTEW